jgi:hypothetical protein
MKLIAVIISTRNGTGKCFSRAATRPRRGCDLAIRCVFKSGLEDDSKPSEMEYHRRNGDPKNVYHYIKYLKPDFVLDISNFWEQKSLIRACFQSQFATQIREPDSLFIITCLLLEIFLGS